MYRRWQWLSQCPGQCSWIGCTDGFWGEPAISTSTAAANTPPLVGNQIIQNPLCQAHPCYPPSKQLKSFCGSRAQAGPPGSTVQLQPSEWFALQRKQSSPEVEPCGVILKQWLYTQWIQMKSLSENRKYFYHCLCFRCAVDEDKEMKFAWI